MIEPTANTPELPPFSFKKKPVEQYILQRNHSHISDILPTTSNLNIHGSSEDSSISANVGTAIYRYIDYDEQIRAPRMNSINYYTHNRQKRGECVASFSSVKSKQSSSTSLLTNPSVAEMDEARKEKDQDGNEEKYLPANFDLSKPTRRFSVPLDTEVSESPKTTLLNYTSENYIYQKNNPEQEMLLKALDNLNNNTMSSEMPQQRRIKNRPSSMFSNNNQLNDIDGTNLKQVYEPKKPLCTPAVLRPINSKSEESSSANDENESSPNLSMVTTPIESPAISIENSLNNQPIEPTHIHWKPNNFTNHCMKCFENFGNFFSPIKKRRHHCRYCGSIFCSNCLIDSDDEMALVDENARFIVPIYKNLLSTNLNDVFVKNFKNLKICKKCGETYFNLLNELNLKNLKLPYLFIENPYVHKANKQQSPDEEDPNKKKDGSKNDIEDLTNEPTIIVDLANRKSLLNNVPTDWIWSSF